MRFVAISHTTKRVEEGEKVCPSYFSPPEENKVEVFLIFIRGFIKNWQNLNQVIKSIIITIQSSSVTR
jgi:hypothetical protein